MVKFTDIEGLEVLVRSKRVGIIVENWFYPVPGVQLAGFELEEIVKEMAYQDSPLHNPGDVQEPEIPSFDVFQWYDSPRHCRREAEIRDQPDKVWPEVSTTIRLDGDLYILEKIWPRRPNFKGMTVKKVLPPDFRRKHQSMSVTVELDKKSLQRAKDRMHRRTVSNDQSDSVSRSMKPSGDL